MEESRKHRYGRSQWCAVVGVCGRGTHPRHRGGEYRYHRHRTFNLDGMSRNVMSKLRAVWGIISARGRALYSQWAAARCARRGANLPDGPRFSARPHGGGKGDARVTDVPILIHIPIFMSLWGTINTVIFSLDLNGSCRAHACALWYCQVSGCG